MLALSVVAYSYRCTDIALGQLPLSPLGKFPVSFIFLRSRSYDVACS